MSDVQITITENGPYKVKGPIELFDAAGNPVATDGEAAFLCRCGGSSNKPFCDGTHSKDSRINKCGISGRYVKGLAWRWRMDSHVGAGQVVVGHRCCCGGEGR
jgi:CDGSH-type Zn-finger protein